MTNIIKNNIHLSHQCHTSRYLVGVLLTLVLLIGGGGSVWGDTPIDVPEGLYDVVVSNVTELRAALATGGSSSDRKTIFVKNGTYDLGTAYDTEVKDYTTLVGQSRDGVIIKNSPEHEGVWTSATLRVKSNVIMQNLTLQCDATIGSSVGIDANATENDERGTALYDDGSNNVYKNIRLLSRQSTYYSSDNASSFFENCEIHGAVDFICGSGNVWFEKCAMLIESADVAYITAARKSGTQGEYNGYRFNECTIDNAEDANMAGKYYLGHAWDANAKVSYYKTTKVIAPHGEKWTVMTGGVHLVSVDVESSPANPVSSPVTYKPAPASIALENGVLTWAAVAGASAYAIFDGTNIIAIVGAGVLSYTVESMSPSKSGVSYNELGVDDRYSVAAIDAGGLLGALVTNMEEAILGSSFYYDFRASDFDFDDHDLISRIGANNRYYNAQHGWEFNADNGFAIQVAGHARIYVSRCLYGTGEPKFTVTSDNGGTITPNVFLARSDHAGGTEVIDYEGPAATLSFIADGKCYVHTVKIVNEGAVAVVLANTRDNVKIENNVDGATVYFTTDGSTPTTTNYKDRFTGASYELPVKDCWVKAISVKNGQVIGTDEEFCRTTFAGFSWDFSNGNTLLGDDATSIETGVIIDDRGDVHLVPVGELSSTIDINTAYSDAVHGYKGIYAEVPVEGPVTITIGNCKNGSGKVTVSTEEGQKWDLYPSEAGNCYHEDKEHNFVTLEYTGGPTVLTVVSEADKNVFIPYLSVRDANTTKVTFVNRYQKTLSGTVPEEVVVNEAHQVFIPYNTTLYREGWAVTGWEDSETGTQYDLGRNYTFYQNTTLYPVITKSEKAITDTNDELTITWPFDQKDDAPAIKLHDSTSDPVTMTYVKCVNVEGAMVDVPLVIDATRGKAVNTDERVNALSGNGGQFNDNSVLTLPAVYGMTITLNASDKNDTEYGTATNFTGDNHAVIRLRDNGTVLSDQGTVTNGGKTITFTYDGDTPTIDVVMQKAGSGDTWGFFRNISVTYPVLPNVVTTNVITNADAVAFPNENAEKAGDVTVTLTSAGASHTNTGTRFREGDVVTLSANAEYGYTFTGYRKRVAGGEPVDIVGNEFTVPAEGGVTTIEALFTRKALVKITATSADRTKGTVSLSPKYSNLYNELENGVEAYYESGTAVSVSAEAAKDYVIDKWVDGGTETIGRNVYSFTADADKEVVAHFKGGAIGTVVFDLTGSGVHDVADPDKFNRAVSVTPETLSGVRSFYIPNNYTFFKDQHTLMYWTDGTGRRYELGKYYSFDYDNQVITLTPYFEHNIADKENRLRGDELYWNFLTMNNVQEIDRDTPNQNFFWTSKVSVEVIEDGIRRDHTRDVALWIHTNADGFMRNNDLPDWAAFGPGTTIDLPSCAGATIKIYSYSEITSTTLDGHIPVIDEAATRELRNQGEVGYIYTYTTSNPNPRVTIAIGDDFSYYRWIKCYSLPASLLELHMDVDDDVHGEVVEIKGRGEFEATELTDGGFAFQQGNRAYVTFKRKFGYEFDRVVDLDKKNADGTDFSMLELVKENGVITGVKMVASDGYSHEDAELQSDGTWEGTLINFRQLPTEDGEYETYEMDFGLTAHRNLEIRFVEKPTYYITYSAGEFASGVTPTAQWVEAGDKFTIPYNRTLYYDGYTLKAWKDENNNTYYPGTEYSAPTSDIRLYPVFEDNEFSVLDLEEDSKVTWDLTLRGDAPNIAYERSSGILVAQLWKGSDYIDMKIDLDANGNGVAGKFDNTEYDDRCIINEHSSITFPAIRDCVIELEALNTIPTDVKICDSEHGAVRKISFTYIYGLGLHSVEFGDDGNDADDYQTWCTALSITYKPITTNLPELTSVSTGGAALTASQLATLKQDKEIEISFIVSSNDEFPNVVAESDIGRTSVVQADVNNRQAVITLVSRGGVTIDTYTINFNAIVNTSPVLVGSPSIYVNTTGYNSEVTPLDQPVNGTISIRFNRTMQAVESSSDIRLSSDNVAQGDALTANQGSTLIFRYWNLGVNKEYTLTIPGNTLRDVYNGIYSDDISVTFRTAADIIPVEHRKFNWIVGVDGTLSEGINAANNATGLARYYIFVPDGEYELDGNENVVPTTENNATTLYDESGRRHDEMLGVSIDNNKTRISRANVSLIGQSETGTQIYNKPVIEGVDYTATIHLPASATDFYAQDLTLENRFNYQKALENPLNTAARAVALQGFATRMILKNVSLLGYQNTYYSSTEDDSDFSAYFETSSITGAVDWVSGGGNVWFERSDFIHRDLSGNNLAAPHTNNDQNWGFVFNDCVIGTETASMQNLTTGDWTLARPWGIAPKQSPACTFLNTTIPLSPSDVGWGGKDAGMVLRFHEYKSTDAEGNLVSLGTRTLAASAPAAGSDDCVITSSEAAVYRMNDVLEFDPTAYTAQRDAVTDLSIDGGVLSWDASADGMDLCYFIFKKGTDGKWKYFANVAETSLDFNMYGEDIREGTYMIRAANQRGGLGAFSEEIDYYEAEEFHLTIAEIGQTPNKGWSTICLPHNAKVPAGDIKVYAAVSIDDNIVTLKSVDYITANIGYVVYGAVDTYVFYGSTHKATDTDGYNYAHDSYLSGNSTDTRISAASTNCYTLAYKPNVSGVGFYKYTGTWLNPHKAYLDVEVFKQCNNSRSDEEDLLSKSFSKGIRFVFAPEEGTTDIPLLNLDATLNYRTDAIYDLSGRRVVTPHRGHVYITNGTKTFKK